MREILFRGKRIDNGEWVEGGSIIAFGSNRMHIPKRSDSLNVALDKHGNLTQIKNTTIYKIDPETVGQFTGLTDKNSKKIFEGDIVRITDDYGNTDFCDGGIGAVEFCNGFWYVGGQVHNGLHDLNNCYHVEIIGNIHDNPELLKGGE